MMETDKEKIKIVIVDDHALIHTALKNVLTDREDMVIVGEGWYGEDVFQLVEELHPDILLLDLRMPQYADESRDERFNVIPALEKLNTDYPQTAVIILSQHVNHAFAQAAVEHGVHSYLLKDDELSLNIPEAIDTVLAGRTLFSREINELLFNNPSNGEMPFKLKKRQLEIVQALVRSPEKSNAELAAYLHIAVSTLKGHLSNIFALMGVPNRSALVVRSLQAGIVPSHTDDSGRIILN